MDSLNDFLAHRSVRSFHDKPLSELEKERLIQAAQSGSSSNFVQAYSIIEIQDSEKKKKIEKIANGQKHITTTGVFYIFVADLYRNYCIAQKNNQDLSSLTSMESLIVSIVDTTIAAQNMALFAESISLGICYIGGIRNDLYQVAELLELPSYTFPLFGMTIGYPRKLNAVKPRLFSEEIVKIDRYHPINERLIADYDQQMQLYYQTRERNALSTTWSKKIQAHFHHPLRSDEGQFLQHQGFRLE